MTALWIQVNSRQYRPWCRPNSLPRRQLRADLVSRQRWHAQWYRSAESTRYHSSGNTGRMECSYTSSVWEIVRVAVTYDCISEIQSIFDRLRSALACFPLLWSHKDAMFFILSSVFQIRSSPDFLRKLNYLDFRILPGRCDSNARICSAN